MDTVSPEVRSRIMSSIKGRDTKPEMVVRRFLHANGFRYRLHVKDLPGSPDLIFPSRRLALFVHGCFWHRHSCCADKLPKTRTEYWKAKFDRNKQRDKRNSEALRELGWTVIVFWECETKDDAALQGLASTFAHIPTIRRIGKRRKR